ncbi:fatty acyl-CoA reductase wat-like [Trichogramma pretiosum]|uniref:fatty acyl-CoA reductase wat-like n=1 Tax=Trichogramma pretiosum TaxID=7493 RepID=UPI0006C9D953|nr:fatty acyl-CoA reductase wat-like [Trichogramma pretiosum]
MYLENENAANHEEEPAVATSAYSTSPSRTCQNENNNYRSNCGQTAAEMSDAKTPLQTFYAGQTVFLTGGTGFLGKVLVEKLLRSCPDVKRIYILVRDKRDVSVKDRMAKYFDDAVFDRLKKEIPLAKFQHKLAAVAGDCCYDGLGLSTSDRELLKREVSIVFHVAATVKFDEKLKLAAAINTQSTADMLELCKEMNNLKSFMYVSTAYSNCHSHDINERFYENPLGADAVLAIAQNMPEELLDVISPQLIAPWPNTYTFTKALSEDLLRRKNQRLPMGIFRPGIVISTAKEPMPGWIDNYYGPTGIAAGVASGLLRTMHCDPAANANIVPVDFTVNALLAAAWDVAMQNDRRDDEMLIYNFISTNDAPITWQDFRRTNLKFANDYPLSKAIWYQSFSMNPNRLWHNVSKVLFHWVPAYMYDGLALLTGQEPKMRAMYEKVHKMSDVVSYFSTREWNFANDNVHAMWKRLDEADRELFGFDMKNFDWRTYFSTYIKGIRVYLLKDGLETLPACKRKLMMFYLGHMLLRLLLTSAGAYAAFKAYMLATR